MKRKQLFFKFTWITFILMTSWGYSQDKTVTGKITDTAGIPIPGVNVIATETSNGTISDFDGNFSIQVENGNTLSFSYIGYKTKEITVTNTTTYNITLEEDNTQLDEVIVVGYGAQKKSDITGAVASVAAERLDMVSNTNVVQALQGSVPGVTINNNGSSASGGDVSIVIRGTNSILANTTPLVVLDGFPYSGSFTDINPADIESIEVLKDASAAAIYGSRAANGVILITSKKGKQGKIKFSFDTYYGALDAVNIPDVLSAEEFYEFKLIRDPNAFDQSELDIFNNGGGVDWIDLSLRTGSTMQHNLSVSGGSEKFKYFVSGTFLDVEGIRLNDDFQRSTLRVNLEVNATDWLTIGTNTQLSYSDFSGLGPNWSDAFYMNPLTRSHDENGDLTIYPWEEDVFFGNPLQNTLADNSDKRYKIISNLYFDLDLGFIPGLSYRLNTGAEITHTRQGSFWGVNTKRGLENQGEAQVRNDFRTNVLLENILTYKKAFGKHNVFLTGLYSFQEEVRDDQDLDSQGFPNDILTWRQANVAALVEPGYTYFKELLYSSMLRINYGYDNRYIATLTGRRDSFSAFGNDTKHGNFFSGALAWNIHNETFMENSFFNTLKLRGSYGEVGNQAGDAYDSLTLLLERSYVDSNGNSLPGFITDDVLGNPLLGWETSKSFNLGVDYGILKNRLNGSINVYKTNTTDLLAEEAISAFHGATQ
ncbi:MAG: SusC/RagA family TonB-linked outer membrane protein, partial [Flavobacteriaceae bacterium]